MTQEGITAEINQAPPANLIDGYTRAINLQTGRLAAEINQHTGTGKFPEWWHEGEQFNYRDLIAAFNDDAIDPKYIADYYQAKVENNEIVRQVAPPKSEPHSEAEYLYGGIIPVSTDRLGAALRAESPEGAFHADILADLKNSNMPLAATAILQDYYGLESRTALFSVSGDGFDGQVHDLIRTNPKIAATMYNTEVPTISPDSSSYMEEHYKGMTEWATKAISAAAGIPREEAAQYAFGLPQRRPSSIAPETFLLNTIHTFDHFGVDRLRGIARATGIRAFDAYSTEQLERMEEFVKDPTAAAEALKDKDVTVVLINRVGDHNGTLANAAANFDDDSENAATLCFEINSMADIYRYMTKLKQWGVQPSTVALAAHSGEGQFMVTDDRNPELRKRDIATIASRALVAKVNGSKDAEVGVVSYAIEAADGLPRLIDEYMKPSSRDGKKKIVFQACYAGVEASIADLDEHGEKTTSGTSSVIEKIAEKLNKSGSTSDVEIFGAEDGIQLHRSEHGVRYTGKPVSFGNERSALTAKKVTVKNGHIITEKVDEIVLRAG